LRVRERRWENKERGDEGEGEKRKIAE